MPASAPENRPAVAVFDVDGTLTTRDCVTPFLRRSAGSRLPLALVRHPVALVSALLRRDNDRLKELASESLRGVEADEVARLGTTFAREIEERLLRPDTVARLHRHRELGHTVALASASFAAYLIPLGTRLGAEAVICTELEVGADGRLTGRLKGRNCRGHEKARRVQEWLTGAGLDAATLWAYGDSPADAPLLELADHAVWVRRATIDPDPTGSD